MERARTPHLLHRVFHCCRVLGVLLSLWALLEMMAVGQEANWTVGKLIGLRAGTCIREGPGLNYRAHTRVPEDNWIVMVIDGPRQANGKTWYDTSRKAAGDPSGGTGWVMADWSDRDCSSPVAAPQPQPQPQPQPAPSVPVPPNPDNLLQQLRAWWNAQSPLMKWIVALVAVALLIMIWRRVGSHLVSLVFAIIGALLLVWLMDGIREMWQGPWQSLVGTDAPDLALLVGAIPLVSWLLGLLRRRAA
jgi:hypothetical protein